jgi:hypothetical protein
MKTRNLVIVFILTSFFCCNSNKESNRRVVIDGNPKNIPTHNARKRIQKLKVVTENSEEVENSNIPINKNCYCEENPLMTENTISCDTTIFSNKSKIYWQFNCDKIWLTLENSKKQNFVIDELDKDVYSYTYRLGFDLVKEYSVSLLFRSGCPANGPCVYTLIDKTNGEKLKQFDQLICIDTEIDRENPHKYSFDFVVYFSDNGKNLIIYNIETNKKQEILFPDKVNLTSIVPEYSFQGMVLKDDVLKISYELNDGKGKNLKIKLNEAI